MSWVSFVCKLILCVGQQVERMIHVDQQSGPGSLLDEHDAPDRCWGQTSPLVWLLAPVDLELRKSTFFQFLSLS